MWYAVEGPEKEYQIGVKTQQRRVLDVDDRGRVSLARYGLKDTQVVVEQTSDGGILLHEAVVMTPAEAELLEQALEEARAGKLNKLTLRTDRKQ